jgi:leucyl aminopeptidase
MELHLRNGSWTTAVADWLIVPVPDPPDLSGPWQELDAALGGQLARLVAAEDLTGKPMSTLPLRGVTGVAAKRLLLVGVGKTSELDIGKLDKALTSAARSVSDKKETRVAVAVPADGLGEISPAQFVRSAAVAMQVGSQGQDLFRTERNRFPFLSVELVHPKTADGLDAALAEGTVLGEAMNLTRELINRPPHEITPVGFARRAEQAARDAGLRFEEWDAERLERERMQALLAVARGSDQPPRLVIVEHQGAGPNAPKLALVGKGVTFDSGGLSIKPTDGMLTMKCDMAGAATVLGALTAIARLKLPVNVVGLMGLVENMTGGAAYKLGDILTARNGVTIEVLNTDAEGRLVLADVLSYTVDLGAERIIDLATLTGACVVALGEDVTGAMTNDQSWCDAVLSAAKACGEDVWQLPMFDLYDELIKGDVGDIKNTGGRWGGAITAGKFLQRFVGNKPWVHLDIAGPAFASSNKPHREAGATGVMVKTLVETARRFGA